MKHLLYLFSILLSLGQLQRMSFFNQEVNIYLHEIVMVTIVSLVIWKVVMRRQAITIGSVAKAPIIFLCILPLTLLINFAKYSFFENGVAFLYLARLVLYFGFFIGLRGFIDDKTIKRGIDIFLALTIFFSFIQYFFYSNLRNLYYLGWDPHEGRAFGLFFDTTTSGVVYSMLFFYSLFGFDKHKKLKSIDLVKILLLLILILLTYSRITYISFLLGLLFFYHKEVDLKKIMFVAILCIVALLALPRAGGSSVRLERRFTIVARLESWKSAIAVWKKQPILGVGYNRLGHYKSNLRETSTIPNHSTFSYSSSYLTLLATSGLLGLVSFLYLLFNFYNSGGRLGKTIIIIVSVASLFDNVILTNFILALFFLLVRTSLFPKSP